MEVNSCLPVQRCPENNSFKTGTFDSFAVACFDYFFTLVTIEWKRKRRCPVCNKLLGYFEGQGEMVCPRCRKANTVFFDTEKTPVLVKVKFRP